MNAEDREEIEALRKDLNNADMDPLLRVRTRKALSLAERAANGCSDADRVKLMAEALLAFAIVQASCVQRQSCNVNSMTWSQVIKQMAIRSPYAAASIIIAFLLHDSSAKIITFFMGQ